MSDLTPSIIALAETIKANTETVSNYLQKNSISPLSLSPDAYPFFPGTGPPGIEPFPKPPPEILDARKQVREACELLSQLVTGPVDHFFHFMCDHFHSAGLQFIYHFRIAEYVPDEGDISFKDLASKAGVDEGRCTRILRMQMTYNYFREPRKGYVAHTVGSKLFNHPTKRDGLGYIIEEGFPGSSKICEAFEKFPGSQERNETPWNVAHGTSLPIFEFFETQPARMKRFFGSIKAFGEGEGFDLHHMIAGFHWKGIGQGLVVDVGGNHGHCSYAISQVAPDLRFIVQDLEKVIAEAKGRQPEGKETEKIKFEVHDFFTPQPIKSADVYLLRLICHDYSDKYAAKILKNLVSAMGPKSRLVLVDSVMPDPGTLSKIDERRLRILDAEMMLTYNAAERDLEGWKSLFNQADPRLELRSVVTPPGSSLSVLEIGLRE
ncbi:uncharacterized protein Z518_07147 [Rhinocladiella mackenziei CBS 650.93]|uniref:O-methyltransferase C-terminal domain-containing protein n=1 Tax=Rhinocladiella mackenziei CBS 650.93 TaxID=1442369 RepID=A0A0D2ICM1_9EURO|nr:uncharacterized protein Z518_07147 [Rhinocladiella mackenziei CBS 650.93]KIX03594.1 hypothetical protein Z518_07147 [Rhinocladiella mackenziei CBS 650.93]